MFVDHIKIHAKAGDGGDGSSHFRREKALPNGGPDGGDGGRGGSVILIVDEHTDNLRYFFYRPEYKAEAGIPGKGQKRTGRSGKDLILKVPPGTTIYRSKPKEPKKRSADDFIEPDLSDANWSGNFVENSDGELLLMSRDESSEELVAPTEVDESKEPAKSQDAAEPSGDDSGDTDSKPDEEADFLVDDDDDGSSEFFEDGEEESDEEEHPYGTVVADLTNAGDKLVLCKGGGGGTGNWRFRTDTNQAPIEFTMGEPGEEDWFYLELRRIADIGLVGFPNAGKSTLLNTISNASPKVAAYPFTTLRPMVGVVDFPGFYRTTVADIPGLIEGAHANVGLGHDFLRHISRCTYFLFVVDTAAVDQRDPISDIQILRKELRLYDEELGEREWLIVANKVDLEESNMYLEALKNRFPKQEIFPISAESGEGIEALKKRLCDLSGSRPS